MPKPSLPPLSPPPIPSGRALREEPQKRGNNFLFIVALTFLIVWSFQLLSRKDKELAVERPTADRNAEIAAPPRLPIPTAAESEKLLAELPAEALAAAQKENTTVFHTLGSADPDSPYRMLVTLSSRGGAIKRLELNELSYRDCSDPTGYLGQIIANESLCALDFEAGKKGVAVQTVGAGTPAANAQLAVGDRIVSIKRKPKRGTPGDEITVDSFDALRNELLATRPGDVVTLGILRAANADSSDAPIESVDVELARAPISLLRPFGPVANYDDYKNLAGLQGASFVMPDDYFATGAFDLKSTQRKRNSDPASFLLTLADYDDKEKLDWPKSFDSTDPKVSVARSPLLESELSDLDYQDGEWSQSENTLRRGQWELLADESNEQQAVFRKILLGRRLEIRKTYRLEPVALADGEKKRADAPEYHLTLSVECRNLDPANGHQVSYYLDGPTGLPIEGAWYSAGRKTGPGWGSYGLRDLVVGLNGGRSLHVIKCVDIATEKKMPSDPVDIDFLGIDTQYFQCTLIPERPENQAWHGEYMPLRVGARIMNLPGFTNTSFRLKSPTLQLAAAGTEGDRLVQNYTIFAGPKQQPVLDAYRLGNTLVYGWFWFVAKPLVALLHFFRNYMVFNYGLAIILLTVLVRMAMFPLTKKQIASSLKMQKIQPQLNALKEKYKDKPQEMMAAQRELWKKHKINPLGGCLPLLIQMPIFIGLYKALSLDVNLYGTPLFSEGIRWCGNLAAPDSMIDWSAFWNNAGWSGFNLGQGMFALGPYFNLLPMLTIALFLVQQKYMMPPPSGTDAEQAQQRSMRRMMNIMMIVMGVMFFKVPSGLCVYFVASSLWALLERRFHPKVSLAADADTLIDVTPVEQTTDTAPRKNRSRRATAQKPQNPTGIKGWWANLVEQAKEQQKLAKADSERRAKNNRRRRM